MWEGYITSLYWSCVHACMLTLSMHGPTLYSRFAFLKKANVGISST